MDIEAAKLAEGPVVIRSESIILLTHFCVRIIVDLLGNEHAVFSESRRHEHLVASKYVPTKSVQRPRTFPIAQICARVLPSVVEIYVRAIRKSFEERALTVAQLSCAALMRTKYQIAY